MTHDVGIEEDLEQYGWTCVRVAGGPVPLVHTVGLTSTLGHPELVVCGLPAEGHRIVCAMVEDILGGRTFVGRWPYDGVLEKGRIVTRSVHASHHERCLDRAVRYCHDRGRDDVLTVLQVFWPDRAGQFPFDPGCEPDVRDRQPRLDLPFTRAGIGDLRSMLDADPVRARGAAMADAANDGSWWRDALADLVDRVIAAKRLELLLVRAVVTVVLAGVGIVVILAPGAADRFVHLFIGGFIVFVAGFLWVKLGRFARGLR